MTAIQPGQDDSDNPVQEKREQHDQGPAVVEITGADALAGQNDQKHVPDGGFIAWLQVAGSWLLFFNSWSVLAQLCVALESSLDEALLTDQHLSQGHHQYIRRLPDILRNHRLY